MHLQQKALSEKCSVNKGVLQKSVMHCPAILDLQGSNLQLYKIRGVSSTPTTSKGPSTKNVRRA